MSSWPFTLGIEVQGYAGELSFVPDAPLEENLQRFGSTRSSRRPAAGTWVARSRNTLALVVLGPGVLTMLRRARRRAVAYPT